MVALNPIRSQIVRGAQANATAAWVFFAAVVFGYSYAVYLNMGDLPDLAGSLSDSLPTFRVICVAFCAIMLFYLICSVSARALRLRLSDAAINNKWVKAFAVAAGMVVLCYLAVSDAIYLVNNGLIVYTDSPHKILIMLGLAAAVILFAFYTLFVVLLRQAIKDRQQKRKAEQASAGLLQMEGLIQNVHALKWIQSFSDASEHRLMTAVAGIGQRMLNFPATVALLAVNIALFGATAALLVVFGGQDPASNNANATANLTAIAVIVCWVVTLCVTYATIEFAACWWSVSQATSDQVSDGCYAYLTAVYDKFYLVPVAAEVDKGIRGYALAGQAGSARAAAIRFVDGTATIVSDQIDSFASELKDQLGVAIVPGKGDAREGTVAVGRSALANIRLMVFASYWSVAATEFRRN